jgi:phosphoribosylformylglycinamidine (FGAM) synthase PurS component
VPMTLEELQLEWKAIHEAYRTLIFRNVHIVQTSPDVIELSMEEVEQEHAEKQVDLILNSFLGLGIPIETIKVSEPIIILDPYMA